MVYICLLAASWAKIEVKTPFFSITSKSTTKSAKVYALCKWQILQRYATFRKFATHHWKAEKMGFHVVQVTLATCIPYGSSHTKTKIIA